MFNRLHGALGEENHGSHKRGSSLELQAVIRWKSRWSPMLSLRQWRILSFKYGHFSWQTVKWPKGNQWLDAHLSDTAIPTCSCTGVSSCTSSCSKSTRRTRQVGTALNGNLETCCQTGSASRMLLICGCVWNWGWPPKWLLRINHEIWGFHYFQTALFAWYSEKQSQQCIWSACFSRSVLSTASVQAA